MLKRREQNGTFEFRRTVRKKWKKQVLACEKAGFQL
jgi:hypothetical protein